MESGKFSQKEQTIFSALTGIKAGADEQVLQNTRVIENEDYLDQMMISLVVEEFKNKKKISLNPDTTRYINKLVVNEYIKEFYGNGHAA